MRVNTENIKKTLKKTFTQVIEEKRQNGTIIFHIRFVDNKGRKMQSLYEDISVNVSKTLECINFIFLTKGVGRNKFLIDCIIGVNSLTGVVANFHSRLDIAMQYLIEYNLHMISNLTRLDNISQVSTCLSKLDFSTNIEQNRYFGSDRTDRVLDLIASSQEMFFVGGLFSFSKAEAKNMPSVRERKSFDMVSFVNLLNCYLLIKNYFFNNGVLFFKKDDNSFIKIGDVYFLRDNLKNILEFLNSEFPGQLSALNFNELIIKWGEIVLDKIIQNQTLLLTNKVYGEVDKILSISGTKKEDEKL